MTTFDLRQHIREVLATTNEENLDALADLVYQKTSRKMMPIAYRQALTDIVRGELAYAPRPRQAAPDDQRYSTGSGSSPATGGGIASLGVGLALTPSGGGNVRNSRAALFRRNKFRMSIHVGNRTFRHILDCTAEDLVFAKAEVESMARANMIAADRYERLLKVMQRRKVEHVGDLTDDEIAEIFAGADDE